MPLTEYEALSNSPEIDKAHITSIINEVSMDVFIKKVGLMLLSQELQPH